MSTKISNMMSAMPPYNLIGVLLLKYSNGNFFVGTGALIDSTTVLTCAHNLTNKRDDEEDAHAIAITFYPGWNASPFPSEDTQGMEVQYAIAAERYHNGEDDWDVGIVKLEHPFNPPIPALNNYFIPVASNDQSLVNKQLTITGYPGDKDGEMWMDHDTVAKIDINYNTLLFPVDSEEGSSGSPVYTYNAENDQIYQVAIHVARTEIDGLKRDILITPAIYAWIQDARLMDNEVFLTYL